MVDEWLRGDFSVDPYITHHMNHEQINTAFDLLKAGESIRSGNSLSAEGDNDCKFSTWTNC